MAADGRPSPTRSASRSVSCRSGGGPVKGCGIQQSMAGSGDLFATAISDELDELEEEGEEGEEGERRGRGASPPRPSSIEHEEARRSSSVPHERVKLHLLVRHER
eukprot:7177200-Prymnesium_polylepis.1